MEGKVVAVTGGSKGIGKGIARVFARAGAAVLICSRNLAEGEVTCSRKFTPPIAIMTPTYVPLSLSRLSLSSLSLVSLSLSLSLALSLRRTARPESWRASRPQAAAAELSESCAAKVSAVAADVTSLEDMQAVATCAKERYGGLDVLCANAGGFPQAASLPPPTHRRPYSQPPSPSPPSCRRQPTCRRPRPHRPQTKIEDLTSEEWDAVMATNLKGSFLAVKARETHRTIVVPWILP